jgi:hypothetical protein
LPPVAHDAASGSIGAAHAVAAQLPSPLQAAVIDASGRAFTDALGIGFLSAAAISLAVAGIVLRRLPSHHLETGKEAGVTETAAVAV